MKTRTWVSGWLILVIILLGIIAGGIYKVDPYFHYHKPDTGSYFYVLDNQRSLNDGISRYFNYDAVITGTSMIENFKTSEMNEIFDVNSVKIPYSGGSYKEINDNLNVVLENHPDLKMVIRGLDMLAFFDDKDAMRYDMGEYPTYLYDNNPFNDVKYLFNKSVFSRVCGMVMKSRGKEFEPGITSFDDYSRWHNETVSFGVGAVCPDGIAMESQGKQEHLTEGEKAIIEENINENVISLAEKYPSVDFYYFIPPYSVYWWYHRVVDGRLYKQVEAERFIVELILEHENIRLYSFNNRTGITTDLNNYKDSIHYGQWVNSLMLKWMHDGNCLLTKENYEEYFEKEVSFYSSFDYESINGQQDYEADSYAGACLNRELTGEEPMELLDSELVSVELSDAEVVEGRGEGSVGLLCAGSLQRNAAMQTELNDYLINTQYIGAKIKIKDIGSHNYLAFWGRKVSGNGQPTVYVYDARNKVVGQALSVYSDVGEEWHQYAIDLTKAKGAVTIILNGGYTDNTGNIDSTYIFSDVELY